MTYRKYTWAANRIAKEDMAELHKMKNSEHVPITHLVAQAVSEFVTRRGTKTEMYSMERINHERKDTTVIQGFGRDFEEQE